MDKDEILRLSKKDGPDEREERIYQESWNFAGTVVCIICVAFIIYSMIRRESPYPYCFIGMSYCAADNLYRFFRLRRKSDLFSGIAFLSAGLIWLALMFMGE